MPLPAENIGMFCQKETSIELKQLVLTADKKKYWNKFKKSCQTKTNDCYIYKPERSDFYRQMVIWAMRFPMITSKNCFYCQPMTSKPMCSYYQKMEYFLLFNIQQKPIAMNHRQFSWMQMLLLHRFPDGKP